MTVPLHEAPKRLNSILYIFHIEVRTLVLNFLEDEKCSLNNLSCQRQMHCDDFIDFESRNATLGPEWPLEAIGNESMLFEDFHRLSL